MKVKGWKCFKSDLTAHDGFQFEVGGTYKIKGALKMCANGFHFHEAAQDLFNYYSGVIGDVRVCEVVAEDVLRDGDKSCCRKITVLRELSQEEILLLYGRSGSGSGYGSGYGYGSGSGYGYGSGDGKKYYKIPDFITIEEKAA